MTNWFRFIYLKIWGSGPLQWGYCNKIFHLYFHFSYFDGVLNTQKLWCQGSHYLFCDSKLPLFQENYFLYEISKSKTWIWKFKIITICCPQYLHNFKIITINFVCHIIHSFHSINIIGFLLSLFPCVAFNICRKPINISPSLWNFFGMMRITKLDWARTRLKRWVKGCAQGWI